jgi:hypothetical protein
MTNLEHPDALLTKRLGTYTHEYDERDLVLYALGVGCGVQVKGSRCWCVLPLL